MDANDRETVTPDQVLNLPMIQPNDADAATVRDYLIKLLIVVWDEQEGFSGKRPFGNSGWDWDLHVPLVKAGFIAGKVDDDGDIVDSDQQAATELIRAAIQALGSGGARAEMADTGVRQPRPNEQRWPALEFAVSTSKGLALPASEDLPRFIVRAAAVFEAYLSDGSVPAGGDA